MLFTIFLLIIIFILAGAVYFLLTKKPAHDPHIPAQEKHPQDRYTERIQQETKGIDILTIPPPPGIKLDPLDWARGMREVQPEPESPPGSPRTKLSDTGLITRYLPHMKPLFYATGIALLWLLAANWYDNLALYVPPSADSIGDFRILFLKKVVGALIPCLSAVAAAVLMFFMLFPPIYKYLNGWTSKDFDLYSDLKNVDQPGPFRRVLFFCFLFGLFFWAFLHFFPLSLQDLTL